MRLTFLPASRFKYFSWKFILNLRDIASLSADILGPFLLLKYHADQNKRFRQSGCD
jgi:hypothetical protein